LISGLGLQTVKHGRGHVNGDHLGAGETPEQREGPGAGSAAQVQDPAHWRLPCQVGQPGGDLGQLSGKHVGVEVEQLGQGLFVIVMMLVHPPTLREACPYRILSCV